MSDDDRIRMIRSHVDTVEVDDTVSQNTREIILLHHDDLRFLLEERERLQAEVKRLRDPVNIIVND